MQIQAHSSESVPWLPPVSMLDLYARDIDNPPPPPGGFSVCASARSLQGAWLYGLMEGVVL